MPRSSRVIWLLRGFCVLACLAVTSHDVRAAAKPSVALPITRATWHNQAKFKPGQVLVRFRAGTSASARAQTHADVSGHVMKTWASLPGMQLVHLPQSVNVHEAIRRYRQDPNVLYAEPNYILHALSTPNDPDFTQLWNLSNTGKPHVWVAARIPVLVLQSLL